MNHLFQKNERLFSCWYRKFLGVLTVSLLSPLLLLATDRHVALTGKDSNSGTAASPWRSLKYAGETAVAGDVVYIHAGIYHDRLVVRNSGTAGNPIVFRAYNNDVVIIETTETQLYAELNEAGLGRRWFGAVDFYNQSWVEFHGLRLRNVSLGSGFYGQKSHNIIIDNCKVDRSQNGGVNVLLDGVQIAASGEQADPQDKSKWNYSTNITIRNSEFTGCVNSDYTGWTEVVSLEGVKGFEIHHNHMHHNSAGDPANVFGGGGENIDAKRGSSNGSIHDNYVHHSPRVGLYIEAWDDLITDVALYNNEVHDCDHAGIGIGVENKGEIDGVQVYNNDFHNNLMGITFPNFAYNKQPQKVSNVTVYNNTVVDNDNTFNGWGAYGVLLDNPQMENIIVKNNIIVGHKNDHIARDSSIPTSKYTVDNNLFWPVQSGDFMGSNFINADPLFLNKSTTDHRLSAGSPAINAANAPLVASQDYLGNSRPAGGGYDMGAYEHVGAAPQSAPSAPGSLTASAIGYYQVNLSWSDNSGNEDEFVIERKANSGAYEYVSRVLTNVTSYTDFNAAPATTYTYRVVAVNRGGKSAYATSGTATTAAEPAYEAENSTSANAPIQTTNVGFEGSGYRQLGTYIEWNNVNVSTTALYTIQFRYAHGTTPKPCDLIVNGNNVGTLQFVSTGKWVNWRRDVLRNVALQAGINTIRLVPTSGPNSLNIDKMFVYGAGAENGSGGDNQPTVLGAPTSLTATANSASAITLSWTDNSDGETGFKIERKTGTGSYSEVATVGANATSYSNGSLSASTAYTYRVRAYNAGGNSAYSNQSTATTQSAPPGNPPGDVVTTISRSSDDAEQTLSSGVVDLASDDLDLRSSDVSGMRFALAVPQGASISAATVSFVSKGNTSGANTFTFRVQAADNAATFSSSNGNLSRNTSSSSVSWTPGSWSDGQRYTSPDLSGLIQEVVDRSGWSSDNHVVLLVNASSSNKRAARTYDYSGNNSQAPRLSVSYSDNDGGGDPNPSADAYRYLRLTFESGSAVAIQEVTWQVGGSSYPSSAVTSTGQANGQGVSVLGNSWDSNHKLYNKVDNCTGGQLYINDVDLPKSVTLDLGSGNGIAPDGLIISKCTNAWSTLTSFKAEGSNNLSDWTLIGQFSGLTVNDFPGDVGTFTFSPSNARSGSEVKKSVETWQKASALKLYPNPSTGLVQVQMPERALVQIHNSLGQLMLEQVVPAGQSTLDLSELGRGVHLLSTTVQGQRQRQRLILQ